MRLELDDPRLMDYVLGELEDGEAIDVAAALELEENKEARELVEELRGVTEMTRRILHEEDPGVALSDEQRAAIVGTVEEAVPTQTTSYWCLRRPSVFALAAAVLFVVVGLSVLTPDLARNSPERLASYSASPTDEIPPSDGALVPRYSEPEHMLPEHSEFDDSEVQFEPSKHENSVNSIVKDVLRGISEQGSPPASASSNELKNVETNGALQLQGHDALPPAVGSRTQLSIRADFTDEVSPNNGLSSADTAGSADLYQSHIETDDAHLVEARNRLEMKANLRDGLSLSYENGPERLDQPASKPTEEQWAEYNVGNLTGQTALPERVASNVGIEPVSPPNNLWQWNSPTDKPTEIVGGPGSETYVKVAGVKPFLAVKDEPLSTFSIDVDTAAYSNVRRFLSQGQLPPADAVRIEEMINYFAYSYPQPTDGRPFAVAVHGAPAPWAPERQLVRIGVKGKEVPASERPPANLVFLLDVSGSMGDANKLPLVKESMKTLLSQLRPNDRVGIVTYSGNARLVLGSTPCSEGAAITQAIESLNAGGSTNGGGGIQMAYDLAQSNFIKEGINRVIMATDGDFNVGTTEHGDLMGLIESRAKSGVFLTTLGFGMGNLKDSTLEQLANRGNGNYAYIDNHAEARKALVDQLSGTLQTIAKDVKIQVEFNPAKVSHYRLLGYENRALANRDFNDDTKDAGEIGAGHTVTALYEIIPSGGTPVTGVDALKYQSTTPGVDPLKYQEGAAPSSIAPEPMPVPAGEWLTVKMRYKQPEGNESTKIDVPLLAMNGDLREVDADFRFASAVAAFGQVLRNSGYRHPSNFDRIVELARGAANGDAEREAFVDLVITAKTLSAQTR